MGFFRRMLRGSLPFPLFPAAPLALCSSAPAERCRERSFSEREPASTLGTPLLRLLSANRSLTEGGGKEQGGRRGEEGGGIHSLMFKPKGILLTSFTPTRKSGRSAAAVLRPPTDTPGEQRPASCCPSPHTHRRMVDGLRRTSRPPQSSTTLVPVH